MKSEQIRATDLGLLVLVTLLWAICYPLISLGLSFAPPLQFAAQRSLLAGASLLVLALALRRPAPKDLAVWTRLFGVGLCTTTLGFAGMFLAGGLVSPGVATAIANAQPLIAAGLAYFVLHEKLGLGRWIALLIGFFGIVLIALPGLTGSGANSSPAGVAYVLLGAVGVAGGNVLLKGLTGRVDAIVAIGAQFLFGAVFLFLTAGILGEATGFTWSYRYLLILLALALPGTALAFALWFLLLHRAELTRLNTFTFLTPVFALLIGGALFGERLYLAEAGGMIMVLGAAYQISRA